jgi:O-antigen/teichoic acid export membrane protein
MSKSLKVNYFYNLVSTLAGIMFPLITFPYASRVMEADGIGQVGFFTSIISYISLFTSLGIPIYAIREIARVKDDIYKMNRTAIEILLLHTALTVIGYIIVILLCVTVTKISLDIPLFLILSVSIFFNTIGCEWFYKGIEDFQYITLRGLIVRIIYVILLFSFVHSKSDLLLYAALTVLGTVGNNVFNFIRIRKYVKPRLISFKELNIVQHIVPALRIFALNMVISLYINLDTIMIGFLKDNYSVGYYEGATRLTKLLLGVVQALQTTMIPRFSYLAKEDTMKEFDELCQKVVDFVVTISIPMSLGLAVLAPTLIHLFCGDTYEPAILTLEIISPIIFLISLSGIPCFQILYPLGHENLAIWSTATGAFVNLIICFLLIPSFSQNGAAVATLIGEATVTVTMYLYGWKYIHIKYCSIHYLNCLIGGLLMFGVLLPIRWCHLGDWLNIIVIPIVGVLIFSFYLYIRKDSFGMYIIEFVKTKINK